MNLQGKKIAILATNGFEQAELEVPARSPQGSRSCCRGHLLDGRRNQGMGQKRLGPASEGR